MSSGLYPPLRVSRSGALVRGLVPGVVVWLLAVPVGEDRATAQEQRLTVLKEVAISSVEGVTVVSLQADGPLPSPTWGQIDGPPRFFLDFPGITTATSGRRAEAGSEIRRVRVAVHSASPRVTRVVVDLVRQQPVRIEPEGLEAGRLRIVVGGAAAGSSGTSTLPPVPMLPPPDPAGKPPASSGRAGGAGVAVPPAAGREGGGRAVVPTPEPTPATRPGTKPPGTAEPEAPRVFSAGPGLPAVKPDPRDLSKYREQVDTTLNRLRSLRPLLAAIDQEEPKLDGVSSARTEFAAIVRTLAGVRPPDTLRPTHDLLVRAASLALMAATLRDDAGGRPNPDSIRNASSAAAGALLLLDRVCIEIGCAPLPAAR
jgi:hypothetical protein